MGETVLFFGCRKASEDFLYQEELQKLLADGALSQLHVACSRDGPEKVYVQHRLLQQGAALAALLVQQQAHVYVCGATAMGTDVHNAFVSILETHASQSHEEAVHFVKEMQKEARYVQELWTA
jgi:sulfite reductase alpha subunit-like flavoprotein